MPTYGPYYLSKITLPNGITYDLKDQEARDLIAQIISAGIKFTVGWDGHSVPDITKIPYGVQVTYSSTTYTGTLVASATTAPYIVLIYAKTVKARDIYEEYITVTVPAEESGQPDTYFWEKLGDTDIDIDNLGNLAYANTASGSTTLSTVDSASFTGGSASVSATYTPAGSVSTPTITVTPSTTSIQVLDQDGSVSAGSAASFTSGTFSGGSFTQGIDQFTAPSLTTSVSGETLTIGFSAGSFSQGSDTFVAATHGADTFTTNTPTSVTLPTFTAQTVATGITSASSTQPSFTGTEATISSTGTATGTITLTDSDKTINITVSPDARS